MGAGEQVLGYRLDYGNHAAAGNYYARLRSRLRRAAGLEFLEPSPDDRILEIGCNDASFLDALKELCREAVGVDVNREMVERLGRADVQWMSVTTLDFQDGYFDRIIALHVFEHVEDIEAAFRETSRVLKTGGTMTLLFPLEFFRGMSALKDSWILHGNPMRAFDFHRHRLTPGKVERIAAASGFRVKRKGIRFAPFPDFAVTLVKE